MPTQIEVEQLIALFNAGRYAELETRARALVERYPESGRAWKILGTALGVQGKDALSVLQRALTLSPEDASIHNNLGNAWQDLGEHENAAASFHRALELDPNFSAAYNNLGNALKHLGLFDDALNNYRCALEIEPDYVDAYYNLGSALHFLGKNEEAVANYRRAIEIRPDFTEAHSILGNVLKDMGRTDDALASYKRALEINPKYALAHNNMGSALLDLGQIDAAEASFRRAMELKPDYLETRSNLLFAINVTLTHASTFCLEEAHVYGEIAAKQVGARFSTWHCVAKPERLRVGLISGDLRIHPVGHAMESLLEQLDSSRLDLIAYPSNPNVDELAMRIQRYFSAWKPIHGKRDVDVAQLIRADGINILLDLSGHTAHNRLPVFAWKPAPVQASWLGYFATTGVAEMDYLLTSEVAVPQAHQNHFTERVWYLPDIWLCFTPPQQEVPVTILPALTNGYITFGCFQRLDKISDAALQAWGKILNALPDARLLLANKQLGDASMAAQFMQRLQQQGVDPARIALQGTAKSREDYLARYGEVDIMLDTFPYPGVTTTCEALWMGVPTQTLAGDTLLSRQGAGVLVPAGLSDWVATSEEEYVAKAIQFARDLPTIAALRANLRQQVLASPVYDAPRFARNFEAALWGMWRNRS